MNDCVLNGRYEVQGLLGKGSFGQVMKCLDHKTNTMKAVKVIRNKKRFHHQALIEVKILEHLRHKDVDDEVNIVHTFEYVLPLLLSFAQRC